MHARYHQLKNDDLSEIKDKKISKPNHAHPENWKLDVRTANLRVLGEKRSELKKTHYTLIR